VDWPAGGAAVDADAKLLSLAAPIISAPHRLGVETRSDGATTASGRHRRQAAIGDLRLPSGASAAREDPTVSSLTSRPLVYLDLRKRIALG